MYLYVQKQVLQVTALAQKSLPPQDSVSEALFQTLHDVCNDASHLTRRPCGPLFFGKDLELLRRVSRPPKFPEFGLLCRAWAQKAALDIRAVLC